MSPRRNAMRLISSETPCRISNKKPTGTRSRAGQMISPPALVEISWRTYASTNTGHDSHMIRIAIGNRKNTVPMMSIQVRARFDSRCEMTSMRT